MEQNNNNNELTPSTGLGTNQPKKAYTTPKMRRHGSLAELVQFTPDRGRDGETMWTDCTS